MDSQSIKDKLLLWESLFYCMETLKPYIDFNDPDVEPLNKLYRLFRREALAQSEVVYDTIVQKDE